MNTYEGTAVVEVTVAGLIKELQQYDPEMLVEIKINDDLPAEFDTDELAGTLLKVDEKLEVQYGKLLIPAYFWDD